MNIDGQHARWRHLKEDGSGEPARKLAGKIVGVARSGTPAKWSVLVLQLDGTMLEADAIDLVVGDPVVTSPAVTSPAVNEGLLKYLVQEFAGTCPTPNTTVTDWAASLLSQFKIELLEIAAERDSLKEQLKKSKKKDKSDRLPEHES